MDSFRSFLSEDDICAEKVPPLLPDEHVSIRCDNCRVSLQVGPSFSASLLCTNYRLCVMPSSPPEKDCPQRFRLYDERLSFPFWSIFNLRYTSIGDAGDRASITAFRLSRKRKERELKQFKVLNHSLSSLDIVSILKVYLKDMRVLLLDLRQTQNSSNLANHILHFSKPSKVAQLMSLTKEGEDRLPLPFTDRSSWEGEVCRVMGDTRIGHWRVVDLRNEGIDNISQSYPHCVVVCSGLSSNDIREGSSSWQSGRFPIWVWAWRTNSLYRSSLPLDSVSAHSMHTRFEEKVASTHRDRDAPFILSLDQELSIDRIRSSFEKLHKICAVDNAARGTRYGKTWQGRIGDTHWTTLVLNALQMTAKAVEKLVDEERSVILQEDQGRDCSAIVSSLVQICLDKSARRLDGLNRLIQKDWIGLGHPFGRRVLGVGGSPFCPVFLLFLDSLHQLIRLYPTQFEYSSHFLIALWDLTLSGTVSSLTCEHSNEQDALRRISPIFPLESHFDRPFTLLFNNIFFRAADQLSKTGMVPHLMCDIIRPPTTMADILLWDEAYLRWQRCAHIKGGGTLGMSWSLDDKMDNEYSHEMGFGWKKTLGEVEQSLLTSSFPYSANATRNANLESGRPSVGSIASINTLQISSSPPETPNLRPSSGLRTISSSGSSKESRRTYSRSYV